jgi:hypothetical protein
MIASLLLLFLLQNPDQKWPGSAPLPVGCRHQFDPHAIDTTVGIISCSNGLKISYDMNDLPTTSESTKPEPKAHCSFEDDSASYERYLIQREEHPSGNLMCIELESFWGADPAQDDDTKDAIEKQAIAALTASERRKRRGHLSVDFPNYDNTTFRASIANPEQYELALRILRTYPPTQRPAKR